MDAYTIFLWGRLTRAGFQRRPQTKPMLQKVASADGNVFLAVAERSRGA